MCLVTHEMSDTSSVENLALWERRRKCRCVQCPLYLWWLHVSTTRDWMCPRFSILLTLELLCYLPTIYLFDNFNIIFTTSRKLFANCEKLFLLSKIASSTGVEVAQKDGLHYQFNFRQAAFIICVVLHQVLIESRNAFPSVLL